MYVCGRGTNGMGTILPAAYEWFRAGNSGTIHVCGTNPQGIVDLKERTGRLNAIYGFAPDIKYYPDGDTIDAESYLRALKNIRKPACAIIAVPDHLHREVATAVLKKRIPVLVVKPLAPTVKDVLALVKLQERYQVYGAVEFHKRYDRSNLKLKDTLKSGAIGKPLYFIVEYSQRKSIPVDRFREWVERTNIFQYLGIHYVDIIYFATGAYPLRVSAVGQEGYLAAKGIKAHDAIQVTIEWVCPQGSRFVSVLHTNWVDPESTSAMSDQRIKVIGTEGRYEADQKMRGISIVTDRSGIEQPNPDFCSTYGVLPEEVSYRGYGIDSIRQFLDDAAGVQAGTVSLEKLSKSRPTFRESIVPTVIIEAANRSLANKGKWIRTSFSGNVFNGFK